jgi:hypothetical protein
LYLFYVGDAQSILEHGFVDGDGFYHAGKLHRGVWLFDRPWKTGEESAAADEGTVVVDVPDDLALRHEWLQEDDGYRRFLMPAELLNRYLDRP